MKETSTVFFGKKEAKLISGVALISILASHLSVSGWILPENSFTSIINYFGLNSTYYFDWTGFLCVSIFAFMTGFSFCVNAELYEFKNYSKVITRVMKFLISYWIVFGLFVVYAFIFNEPLPPLKIFIQNLFGLNLQRMFVCPFFGWYVYFYVTVMLISPLIVYLLKNKNVYLTLLYSFLLVVFFYLLRDIEILPKEISQIQGAMSKFIRPIVIGFLVAKYQIFDKIDKILNIKGVIIPLVLAMIMIVIRHYLSEFNISEDAMLIVVPFVYFVVKTFKNAKSSKLDNLFLIIGANGMNIWFLHSIFFIGDRPLQWILYLPKDYFLIMIWCIIILLPLSLLCTYIQKIIFTKLLKI